MKERHLVDEIEADSFMSCCFCFFFMSPHRRTYEMNYVFMMTDVRTPRSDPIKHHVSVCKDLL